MNIESEKILEKVEALYFRYGIKSVTMDDASKELGISKKTLYTYVKDKNDLVRKVLKYHMKKELREFRQLISEGKDAIDQVLIVLKYVNNKMKAISCSLEYDLEKYHCDVYENLKYSRRKIITGMSALNMKRGISEGLYRSDIDPEIIAKLYFLKVEAALRSDLLSLEEFTSGKVFEQDLIYHIRGIASEEGTKVINKKLEEFKIQ